MRELKKEIGAGRPNKNLKKKGDIDKGDKGCQWGIEVTGRVVLNGRGGATRCVVTIRVFLLLSPKECLIRDRATSYHVKIVGSSVVCGRTAISLYGLVLRATPYSLCGVQSLCRGWERDVER